ncbi:MAG: thiamine phosphate synthase [Sediminibacterium sp.]|nr:thiamine phosphate synthase [Sediminibacterium sp.]
MKTLFPYKLYLVVSQQSCGHKPLLEVVEQAIKGGVDLVQLREKQDPTNLLTAKAKNLKLLLDKYNVPLIINDNIKAAMDSGAYGIHVGQKDIVPTCASALWPDCKMIGYSIEQLRQLESNDVLLSDYLGISPVFKSSTKTDTGNEWGLDGLKQIWAISNKPLVAIGNINAENAKTVLDAGADCLAVVSAICQADHPEKAAFELRNIIEKHK